MTVNHYKKHYLALILTQSQMVFYTALFGHHRIFIQYLFNVCLRLVCFSFSSPGFQGGDSQQCPPGRRPVQLCLSGGGCLHVPAATQARSESDYRDSVVFICKK